MKIYTNDLVKGHSDFKVKCLTFGLYTQVSDSGPLGPLVLWMVYSTHHVGEIWCTQKSERVPVRLSCEKFNNTSHNCISIVHRGIKHIPLCTMEGGIPFLLIYRYWYN